MSFTLELPQEEELKGKLEKETNQYKQNAIKSELKEVSQARILYEGFLSLEADVSSRDVGWGEEKG